MPSPAWKKDLYGLLTRAENFFKHADKDPQGTLDFPVWPTETILWECSVEYREMTGERLLFLEAMRTWFSVNHVDYLLEAERPAWLAAKESIQIAERSNYFQLFVNAWKVAPGGDA